MDCLAYLSVIVKVAVERGHRSNFHIQLVFHVDVSKSLVPFSAKSLQTQIITNLCRFYYLPYLDAAAEVVVEVFPPRALPADDADPPRDVVEPPRPAVEPPREDPVDEPGAAADSAASGSLPRPPTRAVTIALFAWSDTLLLPVRAASLAGRKRTRFVRTTAHQ